MELITYTFSKRTNSTLQPDDSTGTSHNVTLKGRSNNDWQGSGCSILNPIFIMDGTDFSTANYCKWNGRYYFINDVIFLTNNLIELHCSVDALASWRANILGSSKYVTRVASESLYDPTIIDTLYPTKATPTVTVSQCTDSTFPASIGSGGYLVTGLGIYPATSSSGTPEGSFMWFTESQLQTFLMKLSAYCSQDSRSLSWRNYVSDIKWFNTAPGATGSMVGVTVGVFDSSEPTKVPYYFACSGSYLISVYSVYECTLSMPSHPQVSRGTYLNSSTYTHGTLMWSPMGQIDLPIDELLYYSAYQLKFRVTIDYSTGSGVAEIYVGASYLIGKVLRRIDLSGLGVSVLTVMQQADEFNAGWSMAQGILGMGSSLAGVAIEQSAKSISRATTGMVGSLSNIISSVNSYKGMPESIGSNGSRAKFYVTSSTDSAGTPTNAPIIIYTYFLLVDEDFSDRGRPMCKIMSLSGYTGYIECVDVHAIYPCTEQEKRTIEDTLTTGCYIE